MFSADCTPYSSAVHQDDITEQTIRQLIDRFYARVRADATLGPVFARAIADAAWPEHLERMYAFWSSVMLKSGRYRGDPVGVHRAVPGLEPAMFGHWLDLFETTAREQLTSEIAAQFAAKARSIGESLKLALAQQPGIAA